jgi:hypothetical protein
MCWKTSGCTRSKSRFRTAPVTERHHGCLQGKVVALYFFCAPLWASTASASGTTRAWRLPLPVSCSTTSHSADGECSSACSAGYCDESRRGRERHVEPLRPEDEAPARLPNLHRRSRPTCRAGTKPICQRRHPAAKAPGAKQCRRNSRPQTRFCFFRGMVPIPSATYSQSLVQLKVCMLQ